MRTHVVEGLGEWVSVGFFLRGGGGGGGVFFIEGEGFFVVRRSSGFFLVLLLLLLFFFLFSLKVRFTSHAVDDDALSFPLKSSTSRSLRKLSMSSVLQWSTLTGDAPPPPLPLPPSPLAGSRFPLASRK